MSVYTPEQVSQYLTHLNLPERYHPSSSPPLDLSFLTALHTHSLLSCPYENLSIHYNPTHTISLDPQFLFNKIVKDKRGRGGYCMEISTVYYNMLKSIGFDVYAVPAKARGRKDGIPFGGYSGWVHTTNIITFEGDVIGEDGRRSRQIKRYASDVAFGGDGPTRPLLLDESGKTEIRNIGNQTVRLIRSHLPPPDTTRTLHWVYQYRNKPTDEWNSFYAFLDQEMFTPKDYEVMSHWASTAGINSFQTFTVLVIRFMAGENEGDFLDDGVTPRIVGKRMLINNLVKSFPDERGRTELVKELYGEEERVRWLKEYFGIDLKEEEVQGIRGTDMDLGVVNGVREGELVAVAKTG